MKLLRTQNLAGICEVALTDDGTVGRVRLALEGRLESFRSKRLQSRSTQVAHRKLEVMQQGWLMQIQALGARRHLQSLQRECAIDSACVEVKVVAKRRVTIRDDKDMRTGFDHQVLDALVKAGVLINDDTGNLVIGEMVCEPVERYFLNDRECLIITFRRSGRPCRQTITERVLAHGWPDPRTEYQKKEAQKR